ncbi:hypothetical protein ACFQFC_36375 [Amorphoplanes digitatis]|uniref:Uncharacterized protein n=1 Tax=Actinoplanes digitatis TaxID=1868 RepID=A0A7W7HVV2_9ACTN|nr:hypothetical protein [Actinoplanes digitatis]MBB4761636.1 hypothetical protein [Actinoplanes digitatis]GID90746.1 hypothetical protein Adi01nite_01580 [Actinoplanes digitatis]
MASKLLHWATHRIPGVPAHTERPAGHHGTAVHGRGASRPSPNHSPGRPPRFLPGWQRRIGALFGREM